MVSLKLYRRHTADCSAKLPLGSRSYEADEDRRKVKKCACLIHASGTLQRKFDRKCTNEFEWQEAKTVAKDWQALGSWETIDAPPSKLPAAPEVKPGDVTVTQAVKDFLAEHEENAAPNTQKKYKLLMKKFETYSTEKGYIALARWDSPSDIRNFRTSWGVSPLTAAKNMSTIRSFFDFCMVNYRGIFTVNPAKLVKNPKTRETDRRKEQKLPFSDEELKRMYAMCDRWGTHEIRCYPKKKNGRVVESEVHYRQYARKWTGQDLADFISVSVYTGLAISDVSTFHIDRMLETGEIQIRRTKTDASVNTWVPEWLQERIRIRAKHVGPYIFGEHTTKDINVITDVWRRKLKRLWEFCGPFKEKATPHRFRHTFARILLENGVSVRDVAELLGDTEDMVRKHYAAWVPGRQDRLTNILRESFRERPTPNVIVFPAKTGTK
jgi:site-specific recombinase XerD